MVRFGFLAAVALMFAAVVGMAPPPSVAYPPVCSWATNVGNFCITYDPALGRYQAPPAGVTADFARFATETGPTSLPTIEARLRAAAIGFAVALAAGWVLSDLAARAGRIKAVT